MYKITKYTLEKARKLGVVVKISTVKGKKIDVFKNGKKVAVIGALGYNDYPTFLSLERQKKVPKGFADKRRRAYKNRHEKNRHKIGTNGWYADQLLW